MIMIKLGNFNIFIFLTLLSVCLVGAEPKLKVGDIFKISDSVIISPEKSPSNFPPGFGNGFKRIKAGDVFEILDLRFPSNNRSLSPYYYCRISKVDGSNVSMGWLDSGVLIGKEISHQNAPKKEKRINFKIVQKRDVSYPGVSRMTYRVLLDVDQLPSESNFKSTAVEIWRNGNERWKEFTIFMYLPGMSTAHTAYAVAEFRPSGLKELVFYKWSANGTKWSQQLP